MTHRGTEGTADIRIADDVVQWRDAEHGRAGSHLLILLHGYGSNEHDLISLAPAFPADLTLAALRAPLTLPADPYRPQAAYSWFDMLSEQPTTAQIDASVDAVLAWLDARPEQFASVGLLGFSQGGAMTLQLARTAPDRFAYLVQLSGFVFPVPHEGDAALADWEPRIPAFQAWGSQDPVIPIDRTRHTIDWMAAHLDAEQREYPMPHAVVPEEVADIAAFLRRVTGGR